MSSDAAPEQTLHVSWLSVSKHAYMYAHSVVSVVPAGLVMQTVVSALS